MLHPGINGMAQRTVRDRLRILLKYWYGPRHFPAILTCQERAILSPSAVSRAIFEPTCTLCGTFSVFAWLFSPAHKQHATTLRAERSRAWVLV